MQRPHEQSNNTTHTDVYFKEATPTTLADIAYQAKLDDNKRTDAPRVVIQDLESIKGDRFSKANYITQSHLMSADGTLKANELVIAFNERAKKNGHSAFITNRTPLPGSVYIQAGQAMLGSYNRIPEIKPFESETYITRNPKLVDKTYMQEKPVNLMDKFYGIESSYVINPPPGEYGLALSGNTPLIFDSGAHVIHDPNFKFDPKKDFVKKSEVYINRGILHLVRVPPGNYVKININNKPFLLFHREEPYVFNEQVFEIHKNGDKFLFDANDNLIQNGNLWYIRVPPGSVAKVTQNNQPFLLLHRSEPYIFNDPQFRLEENTKDNPFFDATQNLIEHRTIKQIRVPQGKYAFIKRNNQPCLLTAKDEPYFFNDPLVTPIKNEQGTYLVDANQPIVECGNLHVIRVPPGKVYKIRVNNKPWLLISREEPYVFNTPYFEIDKTPVALNSTVISHDTITVLNIPNGKIVKVWHNNQPIILEAKTEPYYFNSAQFRLDDPIKPLIDVNTPVISHGQKHIVRVPTGKVAAIIHNNMAKLLEGQAEPYEFEGNFFEHLPKSAQEPFYDSTTKSIVNGSVKRLLPSSTEKAIVLEGGNLKVLDPAMDGKPIIITDAAHEFRGFIDVSMKCLTYPSEKGKANLIHEGNEDDHSNYIPLLTKEGTRVGARLLVAFKLSDPLAALRNHGNYDEILSRIENITTTAMSTVISKCSYTEYNNFQSDKGGSNLSEHLHELLVGKTQPDEQEPRSIQEVIFHNLKVSLKGDGIDLINFNIEAFKILDPELAASMAKQATVNANTSSVKANMANSYEVEMQKAKQEADINMLKAKQVNEAALSKARADLEAAKLSAEATRVAAEADKLKVIANAQARSEAKVLEARAEGEALKIKAQYQLEADQMLAQGRAALAKQLGESYQQWPGLLEVEKLRIQVAAAEKAFEKLPTLAQLPPGFSNRLGNYNMFLFDNPALATSAENQRKALADRPLESVPAPFPKQGNA